jgi:hypothetical protein
MLIVNSRKHNKYHKFNITIYGHVAPDEERRNRKDAENKMRLFIFEEYMGTCHALLLKPDLVKSDKSLGTQGSITSLKNGPCATMLKLWMGSPTQQELLLERLYKYIPVEAEHFSSISYLKELGQGFLQLSPCKRGGP